MFLPLNIRPSNSPACLASTVQNASLIKVTGSSGRGLQCCAENLSCPCQLDGGCAPAPTFTNTAWHQQLTEEEDEASEAQVPGGHHIPPCHPRAKPASPAVEMSPGLFCETSPASPHQLVPSFSTFIFCLPCPYLI